MGAVMRVIIRGVRWIVRQSARKLTGKWGWCDYSERRIVVCKSARGIQHLDTVIHEMLHACLPDLSEESVYETARVTADVLWRMGYRK